MYIYSVSLAGLKWALTDGKSNYMVTAQSSVQSMLYISYGVNIFAIYVHKHIYVDQFLVGLLVKLI